MKKTLRVTLWIVVILVIIIVGGIGYIKIFLPGIPLQNIKIEYTQERIERGKYLANHVSACIDCHSVRDWTQFSGPIKSGTEGMGGEVFDKKTGFPGRFVAPNITPANLKDWTDAEIYRVITSGINKDGKAIFPVMPFLFYGKMDKEDVYSIIAYIRTLHPIENKVDRSVANFPMNIIINTIPKPSNHEKRPNLSDTIEYGRYLANASACMECHTPFEKGNLVEKMSYAGGREFQMPFGTVVSANITPDKETGIGKWTKEAFVNRFKAFEVKSNSNIVLVGSNEFNTIMPWSVYAGMKTEDLAAIHKYLATLTPIKNLVNKVKMN